MSIIFRIPSPAPLHICGLSQQPIYELFMQFAQIYHHVSTYPSIDDLISVEQEKIEMVPWLNYGETREV